MCSWCSGCTTCDTVLHMGHGGMSHSRTWMFMLMAYGVMGDDDGG